MPDQAHEISVRPALLSRLPRAGGTVTLDGAPSGSGCPRSVAETVVDQVGAYVRALQKNQSGLWENVVWRFPQDAPLFSLQSPCPRR